MGENDLLSILVMIGLVVMSGYFSATETAFSSLNQARMKALAEQENPRAKLVLDLSENYDKLLSTILIGNNIVNIALSTMATVLFVKLLGGSGATVSTVVITIVVLIFGEVSPKSLAKDNAETFAMFSAPLLRLFIVLLTPLNFLFTQWKKLLSRIFRIENDQKITQDELLVMVDEAEEEGGIDEQEGELLRSALEFRDLTAGDILTHRTDLEMVSADATKAEIARVFTETRFSRILVYEDSVDNIVGIIHLKDFYVDMGVTKQPVSRIMTTPLFVPDSVRINDLLELLQKAKVHIAVVTDEYGGTQGIVTMEDILEELVGDIWDEHDEVEETFIKVGQETYLVLGSTDVEEFCEHFDIEYDEESIESSTVSGWVMERMGKVPEKGEQFKLNDLTITVTDSDARHVMEVEVKKAPPVTTAVLDE